MSMEPSYFSRAFGYLALTGATVGLTLHTSQILHENGLETRIRSGIEETRKDLDNLFNNEAQYTANLQRLKSSVEKLGSTLPEGSAEAQRCATLKRTIENLTTNPKDLSRVNTSVDGTGTTTKEYTYQILDSFEPILEVRNYDNNAKTSMLVGGVIALVLLWRVLSNSYKAIAQKR